MSLLDSLADAVEARYANEAHGRKRRHATREERRERKREWRRQHGFGLTIEGPTISISELLKDHLGKSFPVGDNTLITVPALLRWQPKVYGDHVRVEFNQPVTIEVDGWFDWHLAWMAFEDWPNRIDCGIKREMVIVNEFTLPKDWSSP